MLRKKLKLYIIEMGSNLEKIEILLSRLKKIDIELKLFGNFPWIYIDKINDQKVTEKFHAEHGFTLAFLPIKPNHELVFTDIKEIFKLIRKYTKK